MFSSYSAKWLSTIFLVLVVAGCAPIPIPTATGSDVALAKATPTLWATPIPIASPASEITGDPARGAKLFPDPPCSSCHDVTHPFPGGVVAPNLGNVATEAARIVRLPEYHGRATDAVGYIRESIIDPNAYIVPGVDAYHATDGKSAMESDFAQVLMPQQIEDLIAYLMTLR